MLECRIGSVLVQDGLDPRGAEGSTGEPLGLLTLRDPMGAVAWGVSLSSSAADPMSRPILALVGCVSLEEACGRMRRVDIRHLNRPNRPLGRPETTR